MKCRVVTCFTTQSQKNGSEMEKAVRSDGGFRARLDDHRKCSELRNYEDRQSNFYVSYPTGHLGLQGKYEHLQPCCGFGHHPKPRYKIEYIMKSELFNWDQDESYLEKIRGKNECVTSAKFILTSYLFECCYDLLLSKKHNVSNSLGFESVTGQHGTKNIVS